MIKIYVQNGTYEGNFLEAFSGSDAFIKPASKVSAIIFEANEKLFLAMMKRLRTDCLFTC